MRWISIGLVLALVGCQAARADRGRDDDDGAAIARAGVAVLRKHCVRCHSGARAQADFDFVASPDRLVASGFVIPGDAERSLIYRRISLGEMPPSTVKKRPSQAEVAAVRAWIDGMTQAPIPARSEAEVDRLLAADAAGLTGAARRSSRWITLAHLATAGVPAAELDRHRTALAELLASLSWSPAPRPPVAVDPERTLYRIDLRELGWTAATWDAIRAAYPYGIARADGVPDSIRGDWFVATASRAPLYYTILALPDTEAELGRLLGIDLAADISADDVARAGFSTSGVSVNNRVIERHATRYGALWRSYDFRSSVGIENVFAHPLDFVPAGGELIFNLPDGFQAYMLVDAAGRRLDKAPTAIVSDPRRPDRAVENAVSCIGCHANGIVDRADQLRDAADRGFDATDRARIRALHPPAAELTALYAGDRDRFLAALATIGATPPADPADEPITSVVARYEAELDLARAAAELGLRPDELTARVDRSSVLRKTLAALVAGGGVKRDSWEAGFARAIRDLGLGISFTPSTSDDTGPAVWIDRRRDRWVALAGTGDLAQRDARAACRRQGFELPRAPALAAAVADGLATGLRLDGADVWTAGVKLDASNQRHASVIDPIRGTARRADVGERHAVVCVQR